MELQIGSILGYQLGKTFMPYTHMKGWFYLFLYRVSQIYGLSASSSASKVIFVVQHREGTDLMAQITSGISKTET